MFHIHKKTPEHFLYRSTAIRKKVKLNEIDLKNFKNQWRPREVPDLVVVGAPYMDLAELRYTAKILKNSTITKDIGLWCFTTKEIYRSASALGYTKTIKNAGASVFSGCFFEDAPVSYLNKVEIITDSVRTISALKAVYGKDVMLKLAPTSECLQIAQSGKVVE